MKQKLNNYKTLVVVGCSLTYGQGVKYNETWGYKLAEELGLDFINLGCGGTGWYYVEEIVTQFVNNNLDNLDEYLIIIQKSEFARRPFYDELAYVPVNNELNKHGINFLSPISYHFLGGTESKRDCSPVFDAHQELPWLTEFNFPNHRTEPNDRNPWYVTIDGKKVPPPNIEKQAEQLMLHWAYRVYSLHSFLKLNNANYLFVDGYFPMLSNKLNFRKYDVISNEHHELEKGFWSNELFSNSEDNIYLYKYNNKRVGDILDNIPLMNKIDDWVMWGTYFWQESQSSWNIDGGHPGPKGHESISKILLQNIQEKHE